MSVLRPQVFPNDKDAIGELLQRDKKLTTWELDFLDSIETRDCLTKKQKDVLDRIWEEVVVIGRE